MCVSGVGIGARIGPPHASRMLLAGTGGNGSFGDDVFDPRLETVRTALRQPVGELMRVEPALGVMGEIASADDAWRVATAWIVVRGAIGVRGIAYASIVFLRAIGG